MTQKIILGALAVTALALCLGIGVVVGGYFANKPASPAIQTSNGQQWQQQQEIPAAPVAPIVLAQPQPQAPIVHVPAQATPTVRGELGWRELVKGERAPEVYANVPNKVAGEKWHWQTNADGEFRLVLLNRNPPMVTYSFNAATGAAVWVEYGWVPMPYDTKNPNGAGPVLLGGTWWQWEWNSLREQRFVRYSRGHQQ